MFLFLNYLALGSKQLDLDERYGIHQSTVSQGFHNMEQLSVYCPRMSEDMDTRGENKTTFTCRVQGLRRHHSHLDWTELRCQCPSSPLLQSEVLSAYRSHCTLKRLLRVAPKGAFTFIPPLYAGSINGIQIILESWILAWLRPQMVDRGFLEDDFVQFKI